MINKKEYVLDSIIELKKSHPSGTVKWKITRLGADIKIQSTIQKDLFIMMPRTKFNAKLKKIIIK